ncbi:MFS transporter [Thalassotalea aquiviva]|uniref:MFS transporter n=1 Tax=Thalassotalea aquiviva TaxID=3242415 RepID=UPI00352B7305
MSGQWKLLIAMYLGYGAMMICRQMLTIVSPALLADPSLGLSKTDIGDFAAFGTLGALVGKIVWGPLADKIGGRKTFLLGISLSACAVVAFGLSRNVFAFIFFAVLLYGFKSSGWPGLTKLIGQWYQPNQYGRVWSILSTSSRLSVVVGTLFFGFLLSVMSWQYVLFSAAVFAFGVYVFCHYFIIDSHDNPSSVLDLTPNLSTHSQSHALKGTTTLQALWYFGKSIRVYLVVVMLMLLTCLMAFLDFVSVYLMEVYLLTPSQAAMVSTVFPTGSLLGLVVSALCYDKLTAKGKTWFFSMSIMLSLLCLLSLKYLPLIELNPSTQYIMALACIGVFAFCIAPAYYLPMSIFSIEFGGPHSATLVCLIDAFGFAASAAFGFAGGRLADSTYGWDGFVNMLIVLCAITLLVVWAFMQKETHHLKRVKQLD